MWRTSCCARVRIMRAVRLRKDSYTKESCVRWLRRVTFRWTCYSSVRIERWSVVSSLFEVVSLSTVASFLNTSPIQEGLQQYGQGCDGRQVQVL